jgi:hypothetical protein
VQSADGWAFGVAERVEERVYSLLLGLGDCPEALRDASPGIAEIALATRPHAVSEISKMAHQRLHTALICFCVAPH